MSYKYQHYVPQFYLRNFSNNGKSVGSYIFATHKYVLDASIKKICGRDYLYGDDSKIEQWFGKLESIWGKIIKGIIRDTVLTIDSEEYVYLLMLFYLSDVRTSYYADSQVDVINKLYKICAKLYNKAHKDIHLSEDMSVTIDKPNLWGIQSMPKVVEIMSDLTLVLLKNSTSRQFVTSDCPVVKYNSLFINRQYIRNYGYGQVGIQCFFPISRNLCLALIDGVVYDYRSDSNGVITINAPDQIAEFNKLFIKNAKKAIFFDNSERQWVIERMVKNKKGTSQDFVNSIFGNEKNGYVFIGSTNSVHDCIKLPQFRIRPQFLSMPFPPHLAGPLRPIANDIHNSDKI